MTAHVPGPWSRHYSSSAPDEWLVLGSEAAGSPILAAVMADEESALTGATVEANARLITAAPELREVVGDLYRLLREWRRAPFFDDPAEWQRWADDLTPRVDLATEKAMAAIAKAEGRNS